MDETCDRVAQAMGCEPDNGDDLVEAVRMLVQERDAERAKVARLVAVFGELVEHHGPGGIGVLWKQARAALAEVAP